MNRRDDISKLYTIPSFLNKILTLLFWLNTVVAFAALCLPDGSDGVLIWLQVLFALACVLVSVIDDGFFWFKAESGRRQNCIEDAFAIELSEKKTNGYYNNAAAPSIVRYALDNYESAYCSQSTSRKMLPKAIIKTVVAMIVFLISWRAVENGDIVLLVVQTLFSSTFLLDTIMLGLYVFRVGRICDNFYTLFISEGGAITPSREALLLSYSVEYEAIKAFYKIRLDEKIFLKDRDNLSKCWDELREKIKV